MKYPSPGDEDTQEQAWEHEERILSAPDPNSLWGSADVPGALIVYFDGGCRKRVGAGGFVVFREDGKCLGGRAELYGAECCTNN